MFVVTTDAGRGDRDIRVDRSKVLGIAEFLGTVKILPGILYDKLQTLLFEVSTRFVLLVDGPLREQCIVKAGTLFRNALGAHSKHLCRQWQSLTVFPVFIRLDDGFFILQAIDHICGVSGAICFDYCKNGIGHPLRCDTALLSAGC